MKKLYLLLTLIALVLISKGIDAQTIWAGANITFTKDTLADWTLAENQDRLTDSVWITRANFSGIFNIVSETAHIGQDVDGPSPKGTEWAFGNTSDGIENLTFTTWAIAAGGFPPGLIDQDMVVHLIADDIYVDIKFLSWATQGNGGGAFSYERSSDETTSSEDFSNIQKQNLVTQPNPANDYIQITNLPTAEQFEYEIFNTAGAKISGGSYILSDEINVGGLPKGMYFIRLNKYLQLIKFIKL